MGFSSGGVQVRFGAADAKGDIAVGEALSIYRLDCDF